MIRVTLSPEDQAWADEIGRQRIEQAPGNPRFAYTTGRSGLDTHRLGAAAELAFARALKLEWPARVNTFRELPDVDPFWEVRWATDERKIKVAVDDPAHYIVAHVTGRPPGFEVHGCVVAGWAQAHVPATDPGNRGRAAHFVDVLKMTPIDEEFHALCSWAKVENAWICVYCGANFEGKAPNDP